MPSMLFGWALYLIEQWQKSFGQFLLPFYHHNVNNDVNIRFLLCAVGRLVMNGTYFSWWTEGSFLRYHKQKSCFIREFQRTNRGRSRPMVSSKVS